MQFLVNFQDFLDIWGEWPSGLRRCNYNHKVPSSNPIRHSARLRAQPRYEAPGDLQDKYVKTQVINIRWPKVGHGIAK